MFTNDSQLLEKKLKKKMYGKSIIIISKCHVSRWENGGDLRSPASA